MLLCAPAAGVVADRVDRKKLLVITRISVGAVATTLAVLVLSGIESAPMLAGVGFLLGTLFAFMAPAQQAATANSVPATDLTSAISLESAGANLSRIAGPALAAPILAAWGAGWAFAVYALSNLLMVVFLIGVHLSSRLDTDDTGTAWTRWKDGLRHARERPPAVAALLTMSVFSVFGAAHVALYPVFTTRVLGHPRDDFTFMVIASGVGAVVGALATGFRRSVPTLRTAAIWITGFGVAAGVFAMSAVRGPCRCSCSRASASATSPPRRPSTRSSSTSPTTRSAAGSWGCSPSRGPGSSRSAASGWAPSRTWAARPWRSGSAPLSARSSASPSRSAPRPLGRRAKLARERTPASRVSRLAVSDRSRSERPRAGYPGSQ